MVYYYIARKRLKIIPRPSRKLGSGLTLKRTTAMVKLKKSDDTLPLTAQVMEADILVSLAAKVQAKPMTAWRKLLSSKFFTLKTAYIDNKLGSGLTFMLHNKRWNQIVAVTGEEAINFNEWISGLTMIHGKDATHDLLQELWDEYSFMATPVNFIDQTTGKKVVK